MALAFVVPCQAGGSVLLQPHGHGVADVLPAVQKVAERGRVGQRKAEREDVRFCMEEVSVRHFLFSLLPLSVETVAMPMNGVADVFFLVFFLLSFFGLLWCEVDMHLVIALRLHAFHCLPCGRSELFFDIKAYSHLQKFSN